MLKKCNIAINDIDYKDRVLEGVVEILKGNELNIYFECNTDKDNQDFISYVRHRKDTSASFILTSPDFQIVCWDCYVKNPVLSSVNRETGEASPFYTIGGEMFMIGCISWIDYPFQQCNKEISFDKFILEQGAIKINNMTNWNTLGNDGCYKYKAKLDGITFKIGRSSGGKIQYLKDAVEELVPHFYFEFENNTKYILPELIDLLASIRDFFSFITGRYIQVNNVTDLYLFEGRIPYDIIFHANLSYYHPCIEEESSWGENNVTIKELESNGLDVLFSRWNDYYSKNSYPLAFFNRIDRNKITAFQYISEAVIAFDSLSDKRNSTKVPEEIKKLKNEFFETYNTQLTALGYDLKDINIGSRPDTLKKRLINVMKKINKPFIVDSKEEFSVNDIAEVLKEIRVSKAHGRNVDKELRIKPHCYHVLSRYIEDVYIKYVRSEVLRLDIEKK